MTKDIINKHRSVIFLNGVFPHRDLLTHLNLDVPVISADGAANKLHEHKLRPTYIVGDGDSYSQSAGFDESVLVRQTEQDSTDFEKCIAFAREKNLLPSLVLGITGGEVDHTLGNMQALVKHGGDANVYFLDTYFQKESSLLGVKFGIPLKQGSVELPVRQGAMLSILPFGNPEVTTRGLKWELSNHQFSVDGVLGVRNVCKDDRVAFDLVGGGAILVLDVSLDFQNDIKSSFF